MSEDVQRPRDDEHSEPSEAEMGLPIGELTDLRVPPSRGFINRIRNGIDRRRLGSELTDLSLQGVLAVVLEFLDLALQMVTGTKKNDQGEK